MADDSALVRSIGIDARRFQRSPNRRAAALLIVAIGIPSPTNISVPTATYSFAPTTPAVSVSGNQSVTVATVAYSIAQPVPTVINTGAPPEIIAKQRNNLFEARVVVRGGVPKSAIRAIVLAPANGTTITVPTVDYALAIPTPNTINNPGMLYLGSDDGKWPPPAVQWSRPSPARLLLIESGAVNVKVPVVGYSFSQPVPAIQVAGNQSITVPVAAYSFAPVTPSLDSYIPVATVAYAFTPVAPTGTTYTPQPCRVRAFRAGYLYERHRKFGETFDIFSPLDYGPYWLSFVQSPPADWLPFLDVYVLSVDIQRVRPLEQQEVMRLVRDPNGPYRRRR